MRYRVTCPSGAVVEFCEPRMSDILNAQKSGDNLEIAKKCLRKIAGDEVDYGHLAGEGLNKRLGVKDIIAIMDVITTMITPDEGEMGNVRASLVVVA
jgi:hypothetical protein